MAKIIIKELTKKFNDKLVLKNINFEIENGIFAYIGPNGAGKTTTLRVCLKIIEPTKGEVIMYGNDEKPIKRNKIGFVLQDEEPFDNFTPLEYLKFYCEIYGIENKEKIEEILKKFSLDKEKRTKISKFSKGMKRKLCIAKAFIGDPEILFLDEPLEGIEIETRKEIKDILLEMKKDKIIFLTTHNLYEVEPLCDSFGIIMDGFFMGKWDKEVLKDKSLEDFYFEIKKQHDKNTN